MTEVSTYEQFLRYEGDAFGWDIPSPSTQVQSEHRKVWLENLRSGNWAQAEEYLFTDQGYCCLGVASKIAADDPESPVQMDDAGRFCYTEGQANDSSRSDVGLTQAMQKRLNLSGSPRVLRADGEWIEVAGLNDSGTPFSEIADHLENFFEQVERFQSEHPSDEG